MPIGNVNRGKYRVFVGNTQEISKAEVQEEFAKFGKIIEVDLKGAYGFVGYDVEEEAKAAVAEMDRKEFKGRQLNVEISGGRPRTNLKNGKDTTKLHVSGIGYDADLDQLREIFSEFGTVADIHPMQGKDICFLHMDEKSAEHAMVGATGKPFGSHKIKVEYGSLSKKPIYDKHSRKVRERSRQSSKWNSDFNLISRLFFMLRIFPMHPWTILIYFEKNSIYLALLRMPKLSKANI
jgi:RNA recognition motif-containing protein